VVDTEAVAKCAGDIADAIRRKDRTALSALLAPGFVHRTPGGKSVEADAFLDAIAQIPVEILSVTLEHLEVDVVEHAALVTGVQHAQVRVDGEVVDDRRAFVDWFIKEDGVWRLRVAAELNP
jgi:ketosteroid isomerase-like protein